MRRKLVIILNKFLLFAGYVLARLLSVKFHRQNKSVNYQPLPWIGLGNSRRTKGTEQRWIAIEQYLHSGDSLLDIGGNVGYFVFKAAEKGLFAMSIDYDLSSHMIANYVREKTELVNANFILSTIDEKNIHSLPLFDVVLHFSVFHHWCARWGFETATQMLKVLIQEKTNKKLFFEMGQTEMSSNYNIPDMGNDHKQWIFDFLSQITENISVTHLGDSEVTVNAGKLSASRHLFMIEKVK